MMFVLIFQTHQVGFILALGRTEDTCHKYDALNASFAFFILFQIFDPTKYFIRFYTFNICMRLSWFFPSRRLL